MPLRKVAALLDVDVAILSKMERGQRRVSKDIVYKLAKIYDQSTEELMVLYLSGKVMEAIEEEDLASQALLVAEAEVTYGKSEKLDTTIISTLFKRLFKDDPRMKAAWIFGSFARGEANHKSDIDIMIRFNKDIPITLFDLADVAHSLEKVTKRKVDIVEEGNLRPFALKTAQKDMIKIYG